MSDLTLDAIAKMAGVSRATVSRVLNNYPNVRESTRNQVQKIIDETGFRPNLAARSLASQKTNLLGLVIPRSIHGFFSDPYFPRLVEGISQACNQFGYSLSLSLFHSERDERELFPRVTQKGILDGIIVQSTGLVDTFSPGVDEWQVPYIFVGRPLIQQNVSYVDIDNVAGSYSAIMHLSQLGHKRIATITGALNTSPGMDRLEGYKQAVNARGLDDDEDLICEGDFSEISAYYAAQKLISQKPDAMFVASDSMAIGAIRALRETGLKVPEDIAIVSFDDLPAATISNPRLTTIRQPIRRFGFKAVETLLDIIQNGPEPPRRIIYSTELVIRESCGAHIRS